MAGVLRVIVGFAGTLAMMGGWVLFVCAIMMGCLYIARLIPLTGWRRRSNRP